MKSPAISSHETWFPLSPPDFQTSISAPTPHCLISCSTSDAERRPASGCAAEALQNLWLASGKHTKNDGKSPFFMGKSTINGPFSIAMLVYQRVSVVVY